jgi:hypothetical protein
MSVFLDYPAEDDVRWLFEQGVSSTALLEPTPVLAGEALFLGNHTFDFNHGGERVLVVETDCDVIAWQLRSKKAATWRGVAFALGEEAIWNPAAWFTGGALKVHATPLNWLKANREGICIVQPRLTYAMLRHVPRIAVTDPQFGRQVQQWLKPPKSSVKILVAVPERAAA